MLSSSRFMMQQCTFTKGAVNVSGGTFTATDCDFNNAAPQVSLAANARGIITGNRFKNSSANPEQVAMDLCDRPDPLQLRKLPVFPSMAATVHQPARMVMYNAGAAPYNAKNDGTTDNTTAIQSALSQASTDGGGVVFFTAGQVQSIGQSDRTHRCGAYGFIGCQHCPVGSRKYS